MNVALAGTGNTFTFNAGGASGMSAFTGTIHVNDGTQGFLRLSTSTGSTGATFDLGNSTIIMHTRGGQTSNLGGLAGGYGTVLEGARSANAADTYNIGANGLNTTFNGTISNGIYSSITPTVVNITKVGAGTLTLGNTNWYTGATLINAGTLALNNSVIASSSSVTVNTGGTLAGKGGIGSATTIAAGGFLAPGVTGVSMGTMTFSNSLVLAGTVTLDLNRNGGSPINDLVNVAGNALTEGGTLTVNNIGAALQSGDTFDLFTFGSETGTFSTINLPTLDSSLTWDTSQLTTTGIIDVTVVPEPATVAIIGLGGLAALGIRRRKA
jgi:autotransporter-associated beta strand protein